MAVLLVKINYVFKIVIVLLSALETSSVFGLMGYFENANVPVKLMASFGGFGDAINDSVNNSGFSSEELELDTGSNEGESESERPLLPKCCENGIVLTDEGFCVKIPCNCKHTNSEWYPETFLNVSASRDDFVNTAHWDIVAPFKPACKDGWSLQVEPKFRLTTRGSVVLSAHDVYLLGADEFCLDLHIDKSGPVLLNCRPKAKAENTFSKCCPPQTFVQIDVNRNLSCVIPASQQQDTQENWGYHYSRGAPTCSDKENPYIADIGSLSENNVTVSDDGALLLPSHRVPASEYCMDYFQEKGHSSGRKLQVLMCSHEEVWNYAGGEATSSTGVAEGNSLIYYALFYFLCYIQVTIVDITYH